jgi:hypothetical protein
MEELILLLLADNHQLRKNIKKLAEYIDEKTEGGN